MLDAKIPVEIRSISDVDIGLINCDEKIRQHNQDLYLASVGDESTRTGLGFWFAGSDPD